MTDTSLLVWILGIMCFLNVATLFLLVRNCIDVQIKFSRKVKHE